MANHGYMTITGKTQGLISAGCSSRESIGNKCQQGHEDEIMVLSFTHNMSNIENSQRSNHQPLLITKNIDKSSPLLARALAQREAIDCVLDFYRVRPQGGQEKFYTIKIEGGIIAALSVNIPHAVLESEAEPQEDVAIRYQDIQWIHHIANTTGYAFWGES